MDHNINILYEDADVLVVNKPAGLMVHGDGKTAPTPKGVGVPTASVGKEYTLADWVVEQYPETKGVGEPLQIQETRSKKQETIDRPGIVHRLDRDTSGVLVIAKHQKAFDCLKQQFQDRLVEKQYQVICYGVFKKDADTIDRPIGRSASDFRKWSAQRGARGQLREAVTKYEVIKRGIEYTLVRALPQTGRTHQIRVHFKAINHPVVCDTLYAPKQPCALGIQRQALHAEKILFTAPSGERITAEAPLPEDFATAVATL